MFSNTVGCYDVELLVTHPTTKLEDPPCRMSATAYSVYFQLPSIAGEHVLHPILRVGGTVMTRKHVVRLMIHSNYHDSFCHRLVFFVALTVCYTVQKRYTVHIYSMYTLYSILYTWMAPRDWSQHQLNCILVKHRFRNNVKDVQTLPGADIDSDHN